MNVTNDCNNDRNMGYEPLRAALGGQAEAVRREWVQLVLERQAAWVPEVVSAELLERETAELMDALRRHVEGGAGAGSGLADDARLVEFLEDLTAFRVKRGMSPRETAECLLLLKEPLIARLLPWQGDMEAQRVRELVRAASGLVDELALMSTEFYVRTREAVIARQSESLLELATPVVKLWQRMLLLPLVGVLDTARARQVTTRLLNAIAAEEAVVTLIDITGVPVLDTSVAGNLVKTVRAAQMLGAEVILTGVSPEGAQTLVTLGVELSGITTRGSLAAGVAEGFALIGCRIERAAG